MRDHSPLFVTPGRLLVLLVGVLLLGSAAVGQPPAKIDVLRIGSTSALSEGVQDGNEDMARDSFQKFIKTETGFTNQIDEVANYTLLAERLTAGQLHLGVFVGHEFAWAHARQPKLRPLAVMVNNYPYRYVHVLVQKDSKATDFAGLKGYSLALPRIGLPYLRFYVEQQSKAAGKDASAFFAKMATLENVEVALDQVVDGTAQAVAVDRVGLEAYKRRKPGRFAQLKEVLRSEALPPALVAYYDGKLDAGTLKRVQDGLTNAHKKKQGQLLLDNYRLTSFQAAPADLDRVLAETIKRYPPAAATAK
jgi:ABC-type phosphate/phosphonate transport system substrate-binding protein